MKYALLTAFVALILLGFLFAPEITEMLGGDPAQYSMINWMSGMGDSIAAGISGVGRSIGF